MGAIENRSLHYNTVHESVNNILEAYNILNGSMYNSVFYSVRGLCGSRFLSGLDVIHFFPNEVRKNGTKYITVLTIGKLTLVTNTSNVASHNNFEVGKNISIFF